ncbi:MAG: hypothetical protein A3H79_04600 [Candidatus Levybacteria bacterium RIFCSPLOWO2_02_FULL_36_8b]|nr:MAG: hypothetical protein A3H79_04600 [Candidatus Levybacteria bacterium RIFCSPLOWO2_02_FULL_36_8b]
MDDSVFQNTSINQPIKKSSKGKRFLFILIVLIILGGLAYTGKNLIGSKFQKAQKVEVTPTPTEEVFPTETPTPEVTVTPTEKAIQTPTPKPKADPVDKATGLNREDLTIEVQNGGGVVGAASKGADFLKSLGYHVASTGNADNYDYENTVIKVKSDKSKYLPLLKKDLSANYSVGTSSEDLSASSSADALVIIGKQ